MRIAAAVAITFVALASPATAQSDEEYTRARFDALKGKTMGQISNEYGRFPVNMYDDNEGRNFIFEFGTCTAMLKTKQVDSRGNADSWVVYGYSARGWCGALF